MTPKHFRVTRREFLQAAAVAGIGLTIPSFLARAALAQPGPGSALGAKDSPILVVLQLGGGNDGLNTVVPYANDHYRRARSRIGLSGDRLIRIDDALGLNSQLRPLADLMEAGELGIVNGVGYPNPNRSHFRSMEIWQTAVDSDRYSNTGWIGRYVDNQCEGEACRPEGAVNVGPEAPQAFAGRKGVGISFSEPNSFRYHATDSGNTIELFTGMNPAEGTGEGSLDFLRQETGRLVMASDRVRQAARDRRTTASYPEAPIGQHLKAIATLIAGGLPTRIYYASMTGFDTHANQQGPHDRLLGTFANALKAFWGDLKMIGAAERTTVVCFSEFGRRLAENASGGTDHGTSGPVFLLGGGVRSGFLGSYPDLSDLEDGDLRHTVDFRSIYAELLARRMGGDPVAVLGRGFPLAGVLKA